MTSTDIKILYSGLLGNQSTYCAWPTVIENDGELLMVCSGGRQRHVCPFGRVYFYRSSDGGRTWSVPEVLSKGPLDDRDAGICRTATGALLVNNFTSIYAFAHNPDEIPEECKKLAGTITLNTLRDELGFFMRRSTDNGKTWSEKYSIPVNNPHGATLLNDGSLLLIGRNLSESFVHLDAGTRAGDRIAVARSVDDGLTWKIISTLPMAPGHSATLCYEPYLIQMPNGRIVATIRDQNNYPLIQTYQSISEDNGFSWSEPEVVSDGYPAHLLKFAGSQLMMTCGFRTMPFGIRIRISKDSGRTWGEERILYGEGKSWDLGYPTTTEMPDGTFFTLWYENIGDRTALRYCRWEFEKNKKQ